MTALSAFGLISFCGVMPSMLIEQRHALFHQALGAGQTDAALVGEQFADRADAAAAEMIDVVQRAFAAAQIDQILDRGDEIFVGQDALVEIDLDAELLVDLVTADAAEIVTLRIEEQPLDQRARVRGRRRIARTQPAIDILERLFLVVAGSFFSTLMTVSSCECRSPCIFDDRAPDLADGRCVSGSKARATVTSPSSTSAISTLVASLFFIELLAQLQVLRSS